MDVYTLMRMEDLIENSEIKIENVDLNEMTLSILLPCKSTSVAIKLDGSDDDSIIKSFKKAVNHQLDQIINHLNACKLN